MNNTDSVPQITMEQLREARARDLAKLDPQETIGHILQLLEIDYMLDTLAPVVYDVATATLDPRTLADTVIDKLNICDEDAARYVYLEASLWHDVLETGCQLQGRQAM